MNLDGSVRNGNSVHHSPTGSQSGAMEDLLAEAVEDHYRQNSKLVKPSAACSCGCSRRYLRILSSILLRQISSLTPYHLLSLLIYSLKSFLTLYLLFFLHTQRRKKSFNTKSNPGARPGEYHGGNVIHSLCFYSFFAFSSSVYRF